MSKKTEKLDYSDSLLISKLQELCSLTASGIVKISKDTNTNPADVANLFMRVFQHAVDELKEN